MKEQWELECEWEDRFRQGRYSKDIWKYIPQGIREGISYAGVDSDGYWIYLEPEWTAYDGDSDCGVIHDYTIELLKDSIKTIRRK